MADVDAAQVAALQADLAKWGFLEAGGPARLSDRGRAALMRAARTLREEELAGRAPPGHPLLLAAERAIVEVAPPGASTPGHHRLLAAIELASLPDGVRDLFTGSP